MHKCNASKALAPWQHACIQESREEMKMLYYSLVFLLIAIVAAIFGFGVLAATSAFIAKILFFVFIVMFLVSLLSGYGRRV